MIVEEMQKILADSDNLNDKEYSKRFHELMEGKLLQAQIEKIKKYRRDSKGGLSSEYSLKFQQYLLYFGFLDEAVEIIHEAWRWKQDSEQETMKYKIYATLSLLNRSRQIMLDMLSLFENGALISCYSLWRSIYEGYILSKYLLQSPDLESKRFIDHAVVQTAKIDKEYNLANKEKIKKLKTEYGEKFANQYGWVTESKYQHFEKLASLVGEEASYVNYQFCSMLIHASSYSINTPVLEQDGLENAQMLGVFTDRLETPFNITIKLMQEFVDMMFDYFIADEDVRKLVQLTNQAVSASAFIHIDDLKIRKSD